MIEYKFRKTDDPATFEIVSPNGMGHYGTVRKFGQRSWGASSEIISCHTYRGTSRKKAADMLMAEFERRRKARKG